MCDCLEMAPRNVASSVVENRPAGDGSDIPTYTHSKETLLLLHSKICQISFTYVEIEKLTYQKKI